VGRLKKLECIPAKGQAKALPLNLAAFSTKYRAKAMDSFERLKRSIDSMMLLSLLYAALKYLL
jgi:hypothetical protein